MVTLSQTPTPEMLNHLRFKSYKERLIKTCHNLHDLVYYYVASTNKISRLLNVHLGTNFPAIPVKEHFSIRENLQLLVSALKEMQATLETKDKDVHESISQSLYAKITSPITSLQDKITAVKELENYKGSVGGTMAVLVAGMLKHDNFPDTLESAINELPCSLALSLQVSELILDYDDIVKMLELKEIPPTTEGSHSMSGTSQQLGLHSLLSSSFLAFLQAICALEEHRSIKKILKIAAEYLEEAFRVLKPPCERLQNFVKMVETCVPEITEK